MNDRDKNLKASAVSQVSAPGFWHSSNFSLLFDPLQDAVIGLDSGFTIQYCNPAVEKLLGWTAAEITGFSAPEVLAPGCSAEQQLEAYRLLAAQQSYHYEGRCAHRDGRPIEVNISAAAIKSSAGQVQGYAVTIHGQTPNEQAATRAVRKKTRQQVVEGCDSIYGIPENIDDGVFAVDRSWRFSFVNPTAAWAIGKEPDQLIGQNVWEVCPFQTGSPAEKCFRQVMEERRPARFLTQGKKLLRHFEVRVYPSKEGITVFQSDQTEQIKAAQALREGEERLKLALQAANLVAWEWNPFENDIAVTGNYSGLFGIPEPTLAKDILHMLHPDDRYLHLKNIKRVLRGEKSYCSEFRIIHPDTKEITWLEEWGTSVLGENGKVKKVIGVTKNITNRKKTELALLESVQAQEETAERFRTSVESLLDGFAIFSAVRKDGKIVDFLYDFINETGCRMNNRTYEEQVGQSLLELLPAHKEIGLFERYVRVVETGEPLLTEDHDYEDIFGGGKRLRRSFEVRAVKFQDGFVLTWRDISERKRSEDQINRVSEKLKQSNKDLEQFAFIASHDLKEPLRKIKQFSSNLRRVLGDSLPENAVDYLNRMQAASGRMETMINNLLELSRVNTRTGNFELIDLTTIAKDVLSDLESRIQTSGGQVVIQPMPVIEADVQQMHELFQNLIGNALKFHRPGVAPRVVIHAEILPSLPGSGSHIALCVEDNGIGFEVEYFDHILQPFQRLHGQYEYEGTGFGLAICKRIVERHQGKIEARSQPGLGSTFIVTLPVRQT